MNPVLLELLPFVRAGLCCSQLLAVLALQLRDEENPAWVAAMRGLCHGIGQSGGPCGLLGGGAMVLAYLTQGEQGEPHPMQEAMCQEYALWFYDACRSFGGYDCEHISMGLQQQDGVTADTGTPDMQRCGDLLARCWGKILEILENYEVPFDGGL